MYGPGVGEGEVFSSPLAILVGVSPRVSPFLVPVAKLPKPTDLVVSGVGVVLIVDPCVVAEARVLFRVKMVPDWPQELTAATPKA